MPLDKILKLTFGALASLLFVTLIIKIAGIPGGMIIPGFFFGGIILLGILLGSLILSALLHLPFKKISFLTVYAIVTTFGFLAFHYHLYSPTLSIIVPNGYKGEIHLVLSNVEENVLTVDSNGIGYLNEWTFNKTYSKPIVTQINGKNLYEFLIGYNPSTFFGKGKTCCVKNHEIQSLSFKIGTKPHLKDEYFQGINLIDNVDSIKTIYTELDGHSQVDLQDKDL